MKVAVVGHGRMGREVEAILHERGHETAIVEIGDLYPSGCAVGIDFTFPESVAGNVAAALKADSRYVVGTTGWSDRLDEVRGLVERSGSGLVHAANFSIGVNLYYRIVRQAAFLLAPFPDYDPHVLERHHRGKKDAPSGTAKVLADIVESSKGPRLRAVTSFVGPIPDDAFHVTSVRAGGIVGDHTVGFDSGGDEILIEHRARTRRGFALGAVLAAEWIATHKGVHTFDAVLDDLIANAGLPASG
jgi:4-hydroxy-tetrahydrodipicolinate reductase